MTGDAPGPGQGPPAAAQAAPLALYRRYRPATFAEVKGQDHVTEPLRQALRSGRINHAYLFSGPRGCGKTSSARILARSLNCEQGPTPDPCGVCASCVALAPSGPGSIDVIEIDAASHGGVDDARDLRERAFYAPVAGRFKIYIIDEAHMVTREGFNALLKLVEEPPPHLKFVFATTEPEKVIATIRSRTHHYPFRLMPPAVLRELLEEILTSEGIAYEPTVLPVVIRAGAGSARDSLSVLDQLIAGSGDSGLSYARAVSLLGFTDDRLLDEVVEAFTARDGGAVFRAIDRVVEGGHDPRRFAADLLDRLRDLIVLAAVPDAVSTGLLDVPADRQDAMRAQATGFGQAELTGAAEIVSAGLTEMRGATSPRLLLELISAQVLLPAPGRGDADLRTRLERLERRLDSGAAPAAAARAAAPPPPADATSAPAAVRPAPQTVPPPPAATSNTQDRPNEEPAASARPEPVTDRADHAPAARAQSPDPARPAPASAGPASAGPASAGPALTGPAAAPPGPAQPAPAAAQPAGPADASVLRSRWPDVLEAVRGRRKVAWILLTNATVESFVDGVLTIEFAREGDAKGFVSSGCDRLLGEILQTMFGISPQLKATARTTGAGGARGGSGGFGDGAGGESGGFGGGSGGFGGGAGGVVSGSPASGGAASGVPASGVPASGGPAAAAQAAARSGGSGAPGAVSAASGPGGSAQPGGSPAGRDPQAGWAEPPPPWDDPASGWEDPRDDDDDVAGPGPSVPQQAARPGAGPAGRPGAPAGRGLTGMHLIERELGGRVIEEFGGA
jgi:DNA polymerase III subunit gamma/tau